MALNFEFIEDEILRDFEDYKERLLESESRNSALCEAYNSISINWNDVLQEAETQDEADYIKDKVKHYAKISDRYCDKA